MSSHDYKPVVFKEMNPVELVEKYAEQTAKELAEGDRTSETTKSQLRRFYQEWVMLRNRTHTKGFDQSLVGIKMLIAKAAYASGRKTDKLPPRFLKWLQANLREIREEKDVDAFGNYFEAMVGYFYAAQAKGSGGREQ